MQKTVNYDIVIVAEVAEIMRKYNVPKINFYNDENENAIRESEILFITMIILISIMIFAILKMISIMIIITTIILIVIIKIIIIVFIMVFIIVFKRMTNKFKICNNSSPFYNLPTTC